MAHMGAIADLWKSERGIVAIALIAACSVLFGLGQIPIEAWTEYTKWIFVTYAAGKTITGAVALATTRAEDTDDQKKFKDNLLAMFDRYMNSAAPTAATARPDPVPSPGSPPTSTAPASA